MKDKTQKCSYGKIRVCRRIGVTALALLLLLGSCMTAFAFDGLNYEDKEHKDIPFSQRMDLDFDLEEVQGHVDSMTTLVETANTAGEAENPEGFQELYDQLMEDCDICYSSQVIAELQYYLDVTDEEASDRCDALQEDSTKLYNLMLVVLQEALKSPYGDVMKENIDESYLELLRTSSEDTEEDQERTRENNDLIQAYNLAVRDEYSCEYQGEEWTLSRLQEEADNLSDDAYVTIYQELYRQEAEVIGAIYQQQIKVGNEEAVAYGYDNYMEYIYANGYNRDYSLEEARALLADVKESVSTALSNLSEKSYFMDLSLLEDIVEPSAKARYDIISPYLAEIDSSLKDVYDYMERNQLYDMDYSEEKQSMGFTMDMPYYGDAFIYDQPYGSYVDYETSIHEFGHYVHAFYTQDPSFFQLSNMDTAEINSYGLEMLFLEYSDDMFGEEASQVFRYAEVMDLLTAIVSSAATAEFELEVYTAGDMTIEEMGKLYQEIQESYGYTYADNITEDYSWVDISHLFVQAGYCISYTTAGLSALDLLSQSMTDWAGAVTHYLELQEISSNVPYSEAIAQCDMRDVFTTGVVEDIMTDVEEYVNHADDYDSLEENAGTSEDETEQEPGHGYLELPQIDQAEEIVESMESGTNEEELGQLLLWGSFFTVSIGRRMILAVAGVVIGILILAGRKKHKG